MGVIRYKDIPKNQLWTIRTQNRTHKKSKQWTIYTPSDKDSKILNDLLWKLVDRLNNLKAGETLEFEIKKGGSKSQ